MKKAAVLIATLFLLSFPLSAQDYLGKITGQVVDESGGLIPGADLTARNEDTGVETSTVSSDSGVYTFHSLLIGSYTVTASLAGLPGISVPCGKTAPKVDSPSLPVGMQLIGRHFEEASLLQLARAFEKAGGFEIS